VPRTYHPKFRFWINAQNAAGHPLVQKKRWIDLVDDHSSEGTWSDVQGTVFEVPAGYHGSLAVKAGYASEGASSKSITDNSPVIWK
jgi:hypothetical protein